MSNESPPPVMTANAVASSDDKIWIVFCHLSIFLGVGILFPLIVYLVKRHDSPLTATHAREALNFHLSIYLYALVSIPLIAVFVGLLTIFGVMVMGVVFPIIACVKAMDGQFYRYPLTIRFLG